MILVNPIGKYVVVDWVGAIYVVMCTKIDDHGIVGHFRTLADVSSAVIEIYTCPHRCESEDWSMLGAFPWNKTTMELIV